MFRSRNRWSGRRGSGQPRRLVLGHLRYVLLRVLPTRVAERVRKRFGGTLVIGDLLSNESRGAKRRLQHCIINGFGRAGRIYNLVRAGYPLRADARKPGGIQHAVPASYAYGFARDRYEKTSVLLLRYLGVDTIFEGALRSVFILDGYGDGPARCKLEVPSDREHVSGVHHIEGGAKQFVGFDRGPLHRVFALCGR